MTRLERWLRRRPLPPGAWREAAGPSGANRPAPQHSRMHRPPLAPPLPTLPMLVLGLLEDVLGVTGAPVVASRSMERMPDDPP